MSAQLAPGAGLLLSTPSFIFSRKTSSACCENSVGSFGVRGVCCFRFILGMRLSTSMSGGASRCLWISSSSRSTRWKTICAKRIWRLKKLRNERLTRESSIPAGVVTSWQGSLNPYGAFSSAQPAAAQGLLAGSRPVSRNVGRTPPCRGGACRIRRRACLHPCGVEPGSASTGTA